ncbi:hypothetical protein [Nocardia thailandica]
MTQPPVPPRHPSQPYPPRPVPPRKNSTALWILLAVVAVVLLVCGGCGVSMLSAIGDTDATVTTTTRTTASAPAVVPPAATTAPKVQRTATAIPSPDFPAGLDARCSQAPADLVARISAKLADPTHRVAHAVVLTSATGVPYIGASIVAADGLMIEKSDVWVNTRSRGMTAATAGARRTTPTLPKTTDVLEIDLGGEDVQTADMCAWKWAKASGYN